MPTTSATSSAKNRVYSIADDGESFELAMFEDGVQVGGGLFPDLDGSGAAFDLAYQLGETFAGSD
jgi:hypothetical protein